MNDDLKILILFAISLVLSVELTLMFVAANPLKIEASRLQQAVSACETTEKVVIDAYGDIIITCINGVQQTFKKGKE